ncbi:MAG: helix-turn-helix domain-containing protein, partial [Desulfobacter sp.]
IRKAIFTGVELLAKQQPKDPRSAAEVLDEIRRLKGLGSDTALGELFEVKQPTVASWRSRNTLPYEEIIRFCLEEGISLDDLFLKPAQASNLSEIDRRG